MPRIPAISISDANEVWYVQDRHVGRSSDTRHKGHLCHGQPKSATAEHITGKRQHEIQQHREQLMLSTWQKKIQR